MWPSPSGNSDYWITSSRFSVSREARVADATYRSAVPAKGRLVTGSLAALDTPRNCGLPPSLICHTLPLRVSRRRLVLRCRALVYIHEPPDGYARVAII